jgi:endonuclease/exonuclease/phosphatase family metal-dependent hydrolase
MNTIPYCCKDILKPLFTIDSYDYLKPIQLLSEHHKNIKSNYYLELLKNINNKDYEKYLKNQEILPQSEMNDQIILEYIKCFPKINFIVVYPKANSKENQMKELLNILQSNGKVYYIKKQKFTFFAAYNLIYSLYSQTKRMKENTHIIYKLNRLGFETTKDEHDIIVILYEHLNDNQPINGSTAPFKSKIRKIFLDEDLKTTKIDPEYDLYPREYDYIHVNDTFNESIEYGPLFFNKNTFKFLKKQHSWILMNFKKGIENFNMFKKNIWNSPTIEHNKYIIMSSGVLFSYGVRDMNDIDGIALDNLDKTYTKDFKDNEIIDISIKGSEKWNDEWEKTLNERAKKLGANDYNDLILNPKFYYYFMGLKFLRLKFELMIRESRGRPAQTTDLLVIHRMFDMSYKLEIPKETSIYNKEKNITETTKVDKQKYLSTMKYYLKERYYIDLEINDIEKWLESTQKQKGGSITNYQELYTKGYNIAKEKQVYPEQKDLIKLGYKPNLIITSDEKPYLYEGESWSFKETMFCNNKLPDISPKKNKLRIVSFNVHNFITRCNQGISPIFGKNLNPFQNGRDFSKFIELFKYMDADILCLQEMVPLLDKPLEEDITDYNKIKKINFDHINKEMEKLGYKYYCIADTLKGKFMMDESRNYYLLCNGIYSKLPIKNEKIFNLFINRNIIGIEIEYYNKSIWILNTHLEYFSDKIKGIDKDIIILQFETLKYIIENEFKSNNIILTGDFNINIFRKSINPRYTNFEEKVNNITQLFNNTSKSLFPSNFHQRDTTDFILIHKKSNLKPILNRTITSSISDHFPVLADFV